MTDTNIGIKSVGLWLRFTNWIVDQGMIFIAYKCISWALGPCLKFLAVFLISTCYYIVLEGLTARTIGKLITGTRVVNKDGARPEFLQIVARSLLRLIPFEPLTFFGGEPRGLHDDSTQTYVIRCSDQLVGSQSA